MKAVLALAASALLTTSPVLATSRGLAGTEPPPGAASCSGCHSAAPGVGAAIPALFGRDPHDIVEALRAFREGTRPATIMNRLAKGFSEEESRAIAAWISAQPAARRP